MENYKSSENSIKITNQTLSFKWFNKQSEFSCEISNNKLWKKLIIQRFKNLMNWIIDK
jgi:hypothetical protein